MESLLLVCLLLLIGLIAAGVYFHNRLVEVEARVAGLEWREGQREPARPPAAQRSRVEPLPVSPIFAPPPPVRTPPAPRLAPPPRVEAPAPPLGEEPHAAAAEAPRPATDWETTLGGNWLNKLGVFIFVIGLALALGYSFTRLGPWGRVGISLCASFAMLIVGVVIEPREAYRTFARGLLGGGWAGLYTTVYAMQAIPAALVVDSPLIGALLLLAVSVGMIVHSLGYRSQTVTALAYFIAFNTLAITQVTWLTSAALIPLAGSLLFIAHRLRWRQIALLGLVATWTVALLRGDPNAGLWQAQAVMAIYWLLFEAFDLVEPDMFLLPLNAVAALGLSLTKWETAAPDRLWWFLAGAAAAYLASTLWRALRGHEWRPAATLAAGLTAAAIFLRMHHQWIAIGLLIEAELIYLTGVRLRQWYLRAAGTALAVVHVGYLLIAAVGTLPLAAWVPVAAMGAAVFYANRALYQADWYWGFAGSGMLALIIGYKIDEPFWGEAWLGLGAALFATGWWRRLFDFRMQGYLLGALGAVAIALYQPHTAAALAAGAAAGIGAVWGAKNSAQDRFADEEAEALGIAGSVAASYFLAQAAFDLLPSAWVAPAWAALALGTLAIGWRWQGYILAALAFVRCWAMNFDAPQWFVTSAATIACLFAAQFLSARGGRARLYLSVLATALATALIGDRASGSVLTVAWGTEGAVLLAAGFPLRDRVLRISGLALLFLCIFKLFLWDLRQLDTLPRIFSFLVLGLILVGVSWVYTRFREYVARYL